MTKSEVRSISLDKLQLQGKTSFLDIGSGTGSVSLQALEFPGLQVTTLRRTTMPLPSCKKIWCTLRPRIFRLQEKHQPIFQISNTMPFLLGSGSNLTAIIDLQWLIWQMAVR